MDGQLNAAGCTTVLQNRLNSLKRTVLQLRFLASAHLFLQTLTSLLDLGQVRQTQLKIDHLRIP